MKERIQTLSRNYNVESLMMMSIISFIGGLLLKSLFAKVTILQLVFGQLLIAAFQFVICYGLVHGEKTNVMEYFGYFKKINLRVVAINFIYITFFVCIDLVFVSSGYVSMFQMIRTLDFDFSNVLLPFCFKWILTFLIWIFYVYANYYLALNYEEEEGIATDLSNILKQSAQLLGKTLMSILKYVIFPFVMGVCILIILAALLTAAAQNTISDLYKLENVASNFSGLGGMLNGLMVLPLLVAFASLVFRALLEISFFENYQLLYGEMTNASQGVYTTTPNRGNKTESRYDTRLSEKKSVNSERFTKKATQRTQMMGKKISPNTFSSNLDDTDYYEKRGGYNPKRNPQISKETPSSFQTEIPSKKKEPDIQNVKQENTQNPEDDGIEKTARYQWHDISITKEKDRE